MSERGLLSRLRRMSERRDVFQDPLHGKQSCRGNGCGASSGRRELRVTKKANPVCGGA